MAPIKSSLARTVGKLLGVSKDTDLSLRGAVQNSRRIIPFVYATGGTVTEPGNGYVYHHFDGVGDIYTSSTVNDTNFSNYSLETRSVSDRGFNGAAPTAASFCIVLKSAQETVDVRTQNTGGSTGSTYSFWYSTDNGSTFSPHPQTHTGLMDGSTAVTIGPHVDGVTHVVYSYGSPGGNRYYWAPTPSATFNPEGTTKQIDIVMTGGGGAGGGTSGGGAGGLVHYTNVSTSNTITLAIGRGGNFNQPDGAYGIGGNSTTLSGPDFPATITAQGGGGGGNFPNIQGTPANGGSGGGGYSNAGQNMKGPGGSGTQPGQNGTYTSNPNFAQYGNGGGAGATRIGVIVGGGGGGAAAAGGEIPSFNDPTPVYDSQDVAAGGDGQPISGFEYPLWYAGDLTPYSPTNNHFAGGGGGTTNSGTNYSRGGYGGGGGSGQPSNPDDYYGIPTIGGGAGGGNRKGGGGSGGVIIRYLAS